MSKLKMVIVHEKMCIGGVETSLINFVNFLKDKYDITVYTVKKGVLDSKLNCKVINIQTEKETKLLESYIKNGLNLKFKEFLSFVKLKLYKRFGILYKKLLRHVRCDADIAICFSQNTFPLYFGVYGIDAKLKLCFVHADVSKFPLEKKQEKYLKFYDKIITVSSSCEKIFKTTYKKYEDKTAWLYNLQDVDGVLKKGREFEVNYPKTFNIVSVSRITSEKAHERTLKVLKKLSDEGFDFIWHVIGDGHEKELIESLVKEYNMQDKVIFYGNQLNPYPYMKSADLLFLGSYHESFGLVLIESQILGVPILTTNTCSAEELVGEYGFICENSEDGIYDGLKNILKNKELLKQKKESLKYYKYDNDAIVKKFIKIIDENIDINNNDK